MKYIIQYSNKSISKRYMEPPKKSWLTPNDIEVIE